MHFSCERSIIFSLGTSAPRPLRRSPPGGFCDDQTPSYASVYVTLYMTTEFYMHNMEMYITFIANFSTHVSSWQWPSHSGNWGEPYSPLYPSGPLYPSVPTPRLQCSNIIHIPSSTCTLSPSIQLSCTLPLLIPHPHLWAHASCALFFEILICQGDQTA